MNNNALPLSVIKVSGNDALTFLQGQLTQDMATLNETWNYAAQCNPQGRVISFFIVFQWDDNYYFLVDENSDEKTVEQLQKYVMRSDVKFEELDIHAFSVENNTDDSEDEFTQAVTKYNDGFKLQQKSGDLIVSTDEPEKTQSANDWKIANIKNHVPSLQGKALSDFTPESINLDLLGAVNFKKGCYTGQEIVARMHYLGKAKKRLFKAKIQGNLDSTKAGDRISDSEGKTIGNLVDFEPSGHCLISIKSSLNGTLAKNKFCIQAVNSELML
jgi:folate-binding protein YgfZ